MSEPEVFDEEARRIQEMLAEQEFEPEFAGRYREYVWIKDALGGFWLDRVFTDVLYRVKAGKEATVYCLRGGPAVDGRLIAAKIYRPRMFRTMRNDVLYRQGRETQDNEGKAVRDHRGLRAIQNRTRFGRQLMSASWHLNEYHALATLHAAGADVPRPIAQGPDVILMEYFGDEVRGAPILHGLHLDADEARTLLDRILWNIELFLSLDRIHADLSAYNILYWDGRGRIIDMPQAVRASTHPQALSLLMRDVERVCQHFVRHGVRADPTRIACDLWDRFLQGGLTA